MIRAYDTAYKVDGRALLAPDEGVEISLSDLDSSDSGRDESGVMHRFVVRRRSGHSDSATYSWMRRTMPISWGYSLEKHVHILLSREREP